MQDLRPSSIAGQWYPADAAHLARQVDAYLAAAPAAEWDQVIGLLAPHAGLRYSGGVAGHAFRAVQAAAVAVVAILCPSHYHADGPWLTSAHAAYETPLGVVPVDQTAVAQVRSALADALNVPPAQALLALRHDREHAIEIELPFLQRALQPGFQLLPLMLRDQSERGARALGAALAEALAGRPALIVVSSDLSHYHPQAEAEALDRAMLAAVTTGDPAEVLRVQAEGRGFACGVGALAAGLEAARRLGAARVTVTQHATSGAVSGDYERVVGYGAAVWQR